MTKIVINACPGMFELSERAVALYIAKGGTEPTGRDDPLLVEVVEELQDEAGGWSSVLKVVEIPDDVEWEIHNYNGLEWIAERHRTWS